MVPVGEENTDRPNTATLSKGGRIKENLKPVSGKGRNENTYFCLAAKMDVFYLQRRKTPRRTSEKTAKKTHTFYYMSAKKFCFSHKEEICQRP